MYKKGVLENMKFFRRFGPHYAIERFGVMFLSLFTAMCILLVSIGITKFRYDTQSLSGMAVYTNAFSMSLSGTEGSVRGVYSNNDHTKAFVLLKFADMTNLPVKASDYSLFLTGADRDMYQTSLKSSPNAMFYLFGSTGYAGIYLYSAEPFESQIMDIIIRANGAFTSSSSSSSSGDSTFSKYNQGRIYFNPGGTYATKTEFLETDDWDAAAAYEELVARPTEKATRTLLRNNIQEMLNQRVIMNEYSNRLVNDGLSAPTMPSEIANDKFYAINPDDKTQEHLAYSISNGLWFTSDSKHTYESSQVHMFLETSYVVPTGYNFTWQLGSIQKGYLKNLTGSNVLSDWDKYFNTMASDSTESTFNANGTFTYSDGSKYSGVIVGDAESSANTKTNRINSEIKTLQDAWSAYYEAKVEYQTVNLPVLLHIESDIKDVAESYTVNTNENNSLLTIY